MRRARLAAWLVGGGLLLGWASLVGVTFYETNFLPQPEALQVDRHYWQIGPAANTTVEVLLVNAGDEALQVQASVAPYLLTSFWLSSPTAPQTVTIAPRSETRIPFLLVMDSAAPLTGGSAKIILDWEEGGEPWRVGAHATVTVAGGLPPFEGERLLMHGLVGAAIGGLVSLLLRLEWRWAAGALVAPLYSRIARSEALEHDRRQLIVRTVEQAPGIHFAELRRRTGLPNGGIYHHLRILEQNGILASRREHGRRTFTVAGAPPADGVSATLAERRLLELLPPDGMTAGDLAARLGITRQGVYYHAQHLLSRGLLRREPGENGWRYYRTRSR